jgi:hypothetical protein
MFARCVFTVSGQSGRRARELEEHRGRNGGFTRRDGDDGGCNRYRGRILFEVPLRAALEQYRGKGTSAATAIVIALVAVSVAALAALTITR